MKHLLAVPMVVITTALGGVMMGAAGTVHAQADSNDALVMLLDQFNDMRSELATLRGIVEEQAYELRRLQQDSLDRYTDLDSRISALYQNEPGAAPAVTPGPATTAPGAGTPGTNPGTNPGLAQDNATAMPTAPAAASNMPLTPEQSAPAATGNLPQQSMPAEPAPDPRLMTEQQLYQLALDSLLQEEEYQRAITQFDQYLEVYPAGRFVTNAWYWKGQAYVNLSMLEDARDAFEVIVSQYPDGRKVDDAMYSLGTVYDRLGNVQRSRELLENVKTRYPNTSAANLSDIYLRSMN